MSDSTVLTQRCNASAQLRWHNNDFLLRSNGPVFGWAAADREGAYPIGAMHAVDQTLCSRRPNDTEVIAQVETTLPSSRSLTLDELSTDSSGERLERGVDQKVCTFIRH